MKSIKGINKEKCKTCKKLVTNKVGILKDGTYQLGQGNNKPLLSFCSKKCKNKYEVKFNKRIGR